MSKNSYSFFAVVAAQNVNRANTETVQSLFEDIYRSFINDKDELVATISLQARPLNELVAALQELGYKVVAHSETQTYTISGIQSVGDLGAETASEWRKEAAEQLGKQQPVAAVETTKETPVLKLTPKESDAPPTESPAQEGAINGAELGALHGDADQGPSGPMRDPNDPQI